ncbi:hypothetical protein TorRG33x02_139140 [Trema orientale]|uniref:Uncharacterized protein n=1 Tax=Trema orientale TaxID=63057 RepID=A0A2P5EXK1_TREOI|nr:hypothetical protein TorRG33x02_139140 [Trema orientale]
MPHYPLYLESMNDPKPEKIRLLNVHPVVEEAVDDALAHDQTPSIFLNPEKRLLATFQIGISTYLPTPDYLPLVL